MTTPVGGPPPYPNYVGYGSPAQGPMSNPSSQDVRQGLAGLYTKLGEGMKSGAINQAEAQKILGELAQAGRTLEMYENPSSPGFAPYSPYAPPYGYPAPYGYMPPGPAGIDDGERAGLNATFGRINSMIDADMADGERGVLPPNQFQIGNIQNIGARIAAGSDAGAEANVTGYEAGMAGSQSLWEPTKNYQGSGAPPFSPYPGAPSYPSAPVFPYPPYPGPYGY